MSIMTYIKERMLFLIVNLLIFLLVAILMKIVEVPVNIIFIVFFIWFLLLWWWFWVIILSKVDVYMYSYSLVFNELRLLLKFYSVCIVFVYSFAAVIKNKHLKNQTQ